MDLHCTNGCGKGKPDGNFCVHCGTELPRAAAKAAQYDPTPTLAPAFLAKGAAPADPLRFRFDDPDPAAREAAWNARFVGKSATPAAPATDRPLLWDPNSPDPAEREAAWQQAYRAHTEGR